MFDLVQEMQEKNHELTISIKTLKKFGIELADAENKYRIEVTKEVLRLRADNMPVTLIQLVVYGQPNVAELRLKRDIAEAYYNANQEHINVVKLQLKIIESQMQREYYSKE